MAGRKLKKTKEAGHLHLAMANWQVDNYSLYSVHRMNTRMDEIRLRQTSNKEKFIEEATSNTQQINNTASDGSGGANGFATRMTIQSESRSPFLPVVLIFLWLTRPVSSSYQAEFGLLPQDEVNALQDIATELGKSDWNFSVNPCSENATSWRIPYDKSRLRYANEVNCSNCSGGICHVVTITLKAQNLPGVLPKSLAKLPYLKFVDLAFNYLTGTIPLEWASMSLESLSVIVNRLSGEIPKYLGNISTLTYLSLEENMFNGTVPAELGNLINLQSLFLSGNYLTGKLPRELTNLSNLVQLQFSRNNFSGQLPDYFTSWRKLEHLAIQSSGFMGPIPSSISKLTNLTDLRISDLDGVGSEFPNLQKMTKMIYLMLRNCKISGHIPEYIAENMKSLKILDLSFNKLNGTIPSNLGGLTTLANIYVTSNFLTEPIPDWIKNNGNMVKDLSYNMINDSSIPYLCHMNNLNLFRTSSREMNSTLSVCLNSFPCSKDLYSLHINCGGNVTSVGKTSYEADADAGGPATFVSSKAGWGFSSSGHFWDLMVPNADFITTNDTELHIDDVELYTEGRTSGMSLTYYGRCLAKGDYTVTLHFAEILFRDNNSFYSLGRRIFDIYIQENLVLKDFDITKEANGTDKAVKRTFNHISVIDTGTIEIRFYYAGKGTVFIPWKGIYGPLISAISVESEFSHGRKKMIILVAASVASLMILIASGVILWRRRFRSSPSREEVLRELDLRTGSFTLRQIKAATNNFDVANLIGKGGFGSVYRGTLLDGTYIAVKQLSAKSSQGHKEFVTEIGMLSGLHHPNLVRLYGCCVHGSELFLVYEYLTNNNLARALFGDELRLDWPTRQRICIGIAKGLAFLHEESALSIIHRDIKANNVLLDEDLNAKISDFGLARLNEEENNQINTRIAGTIGYLAPEYALWGNLTVKADIYSFGVVALEIVAARSNMNPQQDENHFCLLDRAFYLQKKGDLMDIVDPRIGTDYDKAEALRMIKVALLCTNAIPCLRPSMSQVVSMLEGHEEVQELSVDPRRYAWMLEAAGSLHRRPDVESTSGVSSFLNTSGAATWDVSSSSVA